MSTLFFDEERDRSGMERNKMLITFNYQITLMEMKTENRDKIMSHDKPVTAAIYNSVFNQVSYLNHDTIFSNNTKTIFQFCTVNLCVNTKSVQFRLELQSFINVNLDFE